MGVASAAVEDKPQSHEFHFTGSGVSEERGALRRLASEFGARGFRAPKSTYVVMPVWLIVR
jgi:hypothetical protein